MICILTMQSYYFFFVFGQKNRVFTKNTILFCIFLVYYFDICQKSCYFAPVFIKLDKRST